MIQQLFTNPQAIPFNLGKGTYVQRVSPTDTVQLLVAQKPIEIKLWVLYKFYKITQRPGVAEQRSAKSPDPNGSGLLRFIFMRFNFLGLIGYTTKC